MVQKTKLINEMLDLTPIEAGRLDLHKEFLPADSLVAEVIDDFKLSHPQHSIRLKSASNVQVYADRMKLNQVLINVIANAIKYSPETLVVDISIVCAEKEVRREQQRRRVDVYRVYSGLKAFRTLITNSKTSH